MVTLGAIKRWCWSCAAVVWAAGCFGAAYASAGAGPTWQTVAIWAFGAVSLLASIVVRGVAKSQKDHADIVREHGADITNLKIINAGANEERKYMRQRIDELHTRFDMAGVPRSRTHHATSGDPS